MMNTLTSCPTFEAPAYQRRSHDRIQNIKECERFCLWASIRIPVRIGVAFLFPTTRCFGICSIAPAYSRKQKRI